MPNQLNEDLYKNILDSSADLVFLKDSDFRYLMVNEANAAFFGKTKEEVIGKTDFDLMPEKNAQDCRLSDQEAINQKKTLIHVETIESEYWETHKFPVDLPDGNIGIGGIIRNITKMKKVDEENLKLNIDLEERVKKRTIELERINQELESFAYSVSHDLRAPLRAIDGFSGLLRERIKDKIDSESARYLNIVRDNAKRMDQLIKDLLFFSKASRTEIKYTDLDMMVMVDEVFKDLRNPEDTKKIIFEVHTLPNVQGDPSLMRQVWINLIDNAIKYSGPRDVPRIEIGSYPEGHHQIFYVRDNGVGFNPDYTGKLFKVFQRLHGPDKFEGTGVGLAIVQRIVQRHGGEIWAESKENEGAKFFFSIPLSRTHDEKIGAV
jgi:PAS domain S-box-containing protein